MFSLAAKLLNNHIKEDKYLNVTKVEHSVILLQKQVDCDVNL